MSLYLLWVRRFYAHCRSRNVDANSQLTRRGITTFSKQYAHDRRIDIRHVLCSAHSALGAWAHALKAMGKALPDERNKPLPSPSRSSLIEEFARFLKQHRGNSVNSINKKIKHIEALATFLRDRKRRLQQLRLQDVDDFVILCSRRYARSTTADICCSMRSFSRFLLVSKRLTANFAPSIQSPLLIKGAQSRHVLQWNDVRKILRAVNRKCAGGRRDYALLLLMSVYGLGAGEVIRLTLDDIDWNAATLRVTRPKTGVVFDLPLLPGVAIAIANYLRHGRPAHPATRHLFVAMKVPHAPLSGSSSVRHILHKHAHSAGIVTAGLGTHVLRRTQASRQLELGTPTKLIGDILGHRNPASTSAYLQVSIDRLRQMALEVPA